jgi:hypothetical protein
MESKVRDVIECVRGSFQDFCVRSQRNHDFHVVAQVLLSGSKESRNLLCKLVKTIEFGNAKDLDDLIQSAVQLPLGVKYNLVRLFREDCTHKWTKLVTLNRSKSATRVERSQLEALIRRWKDGSVSPEELFNAVYRFVADGTMAFPEAQKLLDLILREGGRSSTESSILIGRSQTVSCLGTYLELSSLQATVTRAEIYTCHGDFIQIAPEQLSRSVIYNTTSECMSSTAQFLWEHLGELDRLQYRPASRGGFCTRNGAPNTLPAERGASDSSVTNNNPQDKPTLYIGDTICTQDLVVEVSTVLMVDSLTPTADVAVPRFVLLLEGRLHPGANFGLIHHHTNGLPLGAFDTTCDGETEVNSPRSATGGDNSSADSADEDPHHSLPPFETERRYLVVFVIVLDDVPLMECACALRDHVLHDQIPTSVRYAAPSLAVVAGTNGLLALVRAGMPDSPPGKGCAPVHAGRQPVSCIAGPRASYTFFALVEDSLQPPGGPEMQVTHEGDAAITALDVCRFDASVDVSQRNVVLVSGDSRGVVCMWAVDPALGYGRLRCPPYQVTSEARRVCSLNVAPSGDHVAMGLLDRLFLLGVNRGEREVSTGASSGATGVVYVRSCLDMLAGAHARYSVVFGSSFLRVWRVTNEVRTPPCPAASHRTELDSYPEQEPVHGFTLLRQDLSTYSMDEGMADDRATRGIPVGQRLNSPFNPQSPRPPLSTTRC